MSSMSTTALVSVLTAAEQHLPLSPLPEQAISSSSSSDVIDRRRLTLLIGKFTPESLRASEAWMFDVELAAVDIVTESGDATSFESVKYFSTRRL